MEATQNTTINPAELKGNIIVFTVGLLCSPIGHGNNFPVEIRIVFTFHWHRIFYRTFHSNYGALDAAHIAAFGGLQLCISSCGKSIN